MSILEIVILSLPIFSGILLVNLIWPERRAAVLLFKIFLGVGIGLGLSSLLYFIYLFFFPGGHWFVIVQLVFFHVLLVITFRTEIKRGRFSILPGRLTWVQAIFLGLAGVIFLISALSTASYLFRRRQGDWDAWMMYNRSALFIVRDQTHWLASFSRQMDPIFHADYPLLLAMNTAWGWEVAGNETPYVPMLQSALFAIGLIGIMFTALAATKSLGQASLGVIILWGTPTLVNEGAREMADLPLTFFILSTVILVYFYSVYRRPALISLAGLTAGLAAWTKNEGVLFAIAAAVGLTVAFLREKPWRVLVWYGLGLAFPLAIVTYFKLLLARPSDVLSNGITRSIQQILEISRHLEILQYFGVEFRYFGGWTSVVGILPVLGIFFLLFRLPLEPKQRSAYVAGITLLVVQLLGDYAVYLITPYDLTWHLTYSIERIALQIFPPIAFLVLCASRTPEMLFRTPNKTPSVDMIGELQNNS
jgi:hypothetical protein